MGTNNEELSTSSSEPSSADALFVYGQFSSPTLPPPKIPSQNSHRYATGEATHIEARRGRDMQARCHSGNMHGEQPSQAPPRGHTRSFHDILSRVLPESEPVFQQLHLRTSYALADILQVYPMWSRMGVSINLQLNGTSSSRVNLQAV